MLSFFAAVLGLAVAGLDPIAALAAVAALSAGASRQAVLVFTVTALLVPVVLGIALSLFVGAGSGLVDLSWVDWGAPWWALLEAAVAVALIWWAIRRRHRPHPRAAEGPPRATGALALSGVAAVISLGVVPDPTFLGTVVLAGRESLWVLVTAHLGWSLVSQAPLVLVGCAVATGRHEAAVRLLNRARERFGPAVRHTVTVLLVIVALVLLVDVATYVFTGEYLVGQ